MQRWRQSGLPGTEFARKHGLGQGSLYRWGRLLDEEPEMRPEVHVGFAEVRVCTSEAEAPLGAIELVAPSGWIVRLTGEIDAEQLRAVLEVVDPC